MTWDIVANHVQLKSFWCLVYISAYTSVPLCGVWAAVIMGATLVTSYLVTWEISIG